MVSGVTGVHGHAASRHVEQGQESGLEHVATQLQLIADKTVRDLVLDQKSVT